MAAGNPEGRSGVTRRRMLLPCLAIGLGIGAAPVATAHGVVAPVAQLFGTDLSGMAAALLAQWIGEARQEMLSGGVQPIPAHIVRGLAGYFPPALLQSVTYRSAGGADLSLPGLAFQYGDVAAMTLIDVIVFQHEADAQTDLKLWAHELTHVMQYRRWGADGFAAHYVADSNTVEREAYGNADRFENWRTSQRR